MNKQHSSKDFASVGSTLKSDKVNKLIHKNILNPKRNEDKKFSTERNHVVRIVDVSSKTMSMTLGELSPSQSTRKHRHTYETLIYIINGDGKSIINDEVIEWRTGDVVYIPVWSWHQHINNSDTNNATYIATENTPLLQNLGVAVREEQ